MQRRKKSKFDKTGYGLITGLFIPIIIFLVVYLFGERDVSFLYYIKNLWYLHALVKLGSLCVFANIVAFMGFIRLKYDRAARGVLGATMFYAFVVLLSRAY